mmetsp:Transcript_12007/g.35659  ORF Transcript_12007/g.35659 Transcript_12007/m.35659 type:complete len:229 (-) Transcript_12007:569-1255(-)
MHHLRCGGPKESFSTFACRAQCMGLSNRPGASPHAAGPKRRIRCAREEAAAAAAGHAVRPVFVARRRWVFWRREGTWLGPIALLLDFQGPELDARPTQLTPILAPRIAHVPILAFDRVDAPTSHRDGVVDPPALAASDSSGIVQQRVGVDAADDRAPAVDLPHHGVGTLDVAMGLDRGVRELRHPDATAAPLGESVARAGPVKVRALRVERIAYGRLLKGDVGVLLLP